MGGDPAAGCWPGLGGSLEVIRPLLSPGVGSWPRDMVCAVFFRDLFSLPNMNSVRSLNRIPLFSLQNTVYHIALY